MPLNLLPDFIYREGEVKHHKVANFILVITFLRVLDWSILINVRIVQSWLDIYIGRDREREKKIIRERGAKKEKKIEEKKEKNELEIKREK